MRSVSQKIVVSLVAIIAAFFSSKIGADVDFIWSTRGTIVPLLMAMMTLYVTLSMNLIKSLLDLPNDYHDKVTSVLGAIKKEMKLELVLLLTTFLLMISLPLIEGGSSPSIFGRCIIDGFIIVDIVLFVISIMDTFFSYIDLMNSIK